MEKKEILEKIENVKNTDVEYEIFFETHPPEELGDAVKLSLNDDKSFKAVVFDPNTEEVFSEKSFDNPDHAYSFINKILKPKESNLIHDYIDLDKTEPHGTLGR
jgi:hypothetical protein